MAYQQLLDYVTGNGGNCLANQVATYANVKADYPHIEIYVPDDNDVRYFNEKTLQSFIFMALSSWSNAQGEERHRYLVRSEVIFTQLGVNRRGDIVVTYTADDGEVCTLWMEIKSNFKADSVNEDLEILTDLDGYNAFNNGYAVYFVQNDNTGWVADIGIGFPGNVNPLRINVNPILGAN